MTPDRGLGIRGVVEGFYGTPWTTAERIGMIAFAASAGMNAYLYAPKSDPYHRDRWREPYPEAELADLARVAGAARERGVRFVYALAPALSMAFSDPADHAALVAKAEQVRAAGITEFSLLFDDVPYELPSAADRERFGDDARGSGVAHGEAVARFVERFVRPHGLDERLLVCPTDYAGLERSPYRDGFASALPDAALVLWTGADIVVGEVTADDARRAREAFGRDLVLWDNFPVNDFDVSRVFLGPLIGRDPGLAGELAGILANPMPQAAASRFGVRTVAAWARDPEGYDASAAWAAARREVAGAGEPGIAALLDAMSAWPPSADRSPELTAAVRGAIAGDRASAERARQLFEGLVAVDGTALDEVLRDCLAPWIDAARATGRAGLLALDVLGGDAAKRPVLEDADTALGAGEKDVLRSITRELASAALA